MTRPYLLAADVGGTHSRLRMKPLEGGGAAPELKVGSAQRIDAFKNQLRLFVEKLPEEAELEYESSVYRARSPRTASPACRSSLVLFLLGPFCSINELQEGRNSCRLSFYPIQLC